MRAPHPWGIAFIGNGQALITEKLGAMRILDFSSGAVTGNVQSVPNADLPNRCRSFAHGIKRGGLLETYPPTHEDQAASAVVRGSTYKTPVRWEPNPGAQSVALREPGDC